MAKRYRFINQPDVDYIVDRDGDIFVISDLRSGYMAADLLLSVGVLEPVEIAEHELRTAAIGLHNRAGMGIYALMVTDQELAAKFLDVCKAHRP